VWGHNPCTENNGNNPCQAGVVAKSSQVGRKGKDVQEGETAGEGKRTGAKKLINGAGKTRTCAIRGI